MEAELETGLFGTLVGAFGELPLWKQMAIVASSVLLSPAIVLIGSLVLFSVFPFLLLGKLEGDVGGGSITKDIVTAAAHRNEATKQYYAARHA